MVTLNCLAMRVRASVTALPKAVKPAKCSVKVLRAFSEVNDTTAEIAINGKAYYLSRHATGYRLTGWEPRKAAVTSYDLTLDLSSCDCPDATYRPREGGCKHAAAVRALQKAGKL